jgi:hypothetical protein
MTEPIRILLQTTIRPTVDDWNIGRFGLLKDWLAALPGVEVVARDREARPGEIDPVLGQLDTSTFDELWLFAVDTGDGLNAEECEAIGRFRARGGGMMVTRDHMDLGCSVCELGGVGRAHYFHSHNPSPDPDRNRRDDPFTTAIDWPNYHSGANGDFQDIRAVGEAHPVLRDSEAPGGVLRFLPAHPHEGEVGAPPDDPTARVIATGVSKATARPFNLAVAFEKGPKGEGRGVAQSTFHHFCDYNLDPRKGAPTFVTEAPGDRMLTEPQGLRSTRRYIGNLAYWLAGREVA